MARDGTGTLPTDEPQADELFHAAHDLGLGGACKGGQILQADRPIGHRQQVCGTTSVWSKPVESLMEELPYGPRHRDLVNPVARWTQPAGEVLEGQLNEEERIVSPESSQIADYCLGQ